MMQDHLLTRRTVLAGLSAVLPLHTGILPTSAHADEANESFLLVSRVITGSDTITDEVARRIEGLLISRNDDFSQQLTALIETMHSTGGDRDQMLSALSDDQVDFALDIAKPWYLGYVGTPSGFTLDDDAEFATFLEAQSWEKIADAVPRITYPTQGAAWWDAAPAGVAAPEMPAKIVDWTFRPAGPSTIQPADAEWRNYATANHDSIDAARRDRPGAVGVERSE